MPSSPIIIDKDRLASLDMSMYALATKCKMDPSNIYRVVTGEIIPSLPAARRIARALGWPLDKIRFVKEL